MKKQLLSILLMLGLFGANAQQTAMQKAIEADYEAHLRGLYEHLHTNPEISFQEEQTGMRMAQELKALGFEVTERVGGFGVVGILRNGKGPTIMVRTDTDALPLEEKTGVPYASKALGKDDNGQPVPAMHACGHDVHMTTWVGTARYLSQHKKDWKGTIVMVAQPAEERGGGAKAMLAEGLFEKFPKPDFALALHCSATLPTGTIGFCPGPALASVDMVDITVYGKGGHGAYPHTTIDPIVLASRMVMAFQTIVSRETSPTDASVVTVGSFHGGTKHNIIPDEVKLQLTLRSYSDAVRQQTLAALQRVCNGIALSAGVPADRMPKIEVANESIPATYNTPDFTRQVAGYFAKAIGANNVTEVGPVMGGEDFGLFGKTPAQVPIFIGWLGTVAPEKVEAANKGELTLPSLHSPLFAPVPKPTIVTGVMGLSQALMELMK